VENVDYQKQYLEKTKRLSSYLLLVPFIRGIILNGSLAIGDAKMSSDIDLLIVAKYPHIFTVRFFANLIITLLGEKRPKDESKSHAGKFCLNYFMTENSLEIPIGRGEKIDQYCADNYINSRLVWAENPSLFDKFKNQNKVLFNKARKIVQFDPINLSSVENTFSPVVFYIIRKTGEWILGGLFGNYFERQIKRFQISMIERDPRTKRYPDLIIYNDRALLFHPPKKSSVPEI